MDHRRYYNRYQRTVPSATAPRQETVPYDKDDCCIMPTTLAMVYAPTQKFEQIYDLTSALSYGTIFKCLNMPFTGKRC